MKTTRLLSLLFSVCQFLLFLKFIEMVRGDPISLDNNSELILNKSTSTHARGSRDFVVDQRAKQRKYKPWLTTMETPTTHYPYMEDEDNLDQDLSSTNLTAIDRVGFNTSDDNHTNKDGSQGSGRLCPGCEGGTCGSVIKPYGFPVIQVIIAFVIGVAWFFAFLFIVYSMHDTSSTTTSSTSQGYGYPASSLGSSSRGGLGSVFNFLTGDNRSLENVNYLTTTVTDALYKLAKVYYDS